MDDLGQADRLVRFQGFELNLRTGELRKDGTRIRLQDQPFKVLTALLQRPGQLVTREELRKQIWPEESFGDFDHAINLAVTKLRGSLGDSADVPHLIETLPRRGYRFIAPVNHPTGEPLTPTPSTAPAPPAEPKRETESKPAAKSTRFRRIAAIGATLLIALASGGWLFFSRKTHVLTDKDTIVLADFTNETGDPVFDHTLRQGLSVQLEQSPFLSIISDQRIRETLQMMGQKPDVSLTTEMAQELCQRTGSAAVLSGTIAQVGAKYLLTLKAVNCSNGESLASTQAQASDKSHVLDALRTTTSEIRNKLGESLSTLQKFDTPLERATTPSLGALRAYSLAVNSEEADADVVPLLQRAIQLDPNFATAYRALATRYLNLGEYGLAVENATKAYALRERASEREKLDIQIQYWGLVVGDLEKTREAMELLSRYYPRDAGIQGDLAMLYANLGQYDKALMKSIDALRLEPNAYAYASVASSYLSLNRWEEARATLEQAQAKKLDTPFLNLNMYGLAFLQGDTTGMQKQVDWAAGKPGLEDILLYFESNTAAYSGQLGKAREFSRQSVASAKQAGQKETAAMYEAHCAVRESLFGNAAEAKQRANAAIALSTGRDVQFGAALALAIAGFSGRAQVLTDDLAKRFPEDTFVQFNYLPTIHARLALIRKDSSKAIQALQLAAPYELAEGTGADYFCLYPVFVRGEAYLAAHQGSEAATEFQKILDHRGIVLNEPIGALAHLQLGRAYAMSGDIAKAKTAYNDFLTLWKDADPDIPILKQAKTEYAKLQ
jgi:DNA-binding winged helix-turn-helix (wHTH) protein/tetratricopeptide (TPR) repeat protein